MPSKQTPVTPIPVPYPGQAQQQTSRAVVFAGFLLTLCVGIGAYAVYQVAKGG